MSSHQDAKEGSVEIERSRRLSRLLVRGLETHGG
jgi:hypothetical protein